MTKNAEYVDIVEKSEENLHECAKKSFEHFSSKLINGQNTLEYYTELWDSGSGKKNYKLFNRTPLQLERDRILYSSLLRKQTEKYHVLYSGQKRITRNYTTHTMRMSHVARSIARALNLNHDFAEAIALGCKAGAAPFIHASKEAIDTWVKKMLKKIDDEEKRNDHKSDSKPSQPGIPFQIELHPRTQSKIALYLPWYIKNSTEKNVDFLENAYSSGQESYWLLCTDYFARKIRKKSYSPETIYGVWQHSRNIIHSENPFSFEWKTKNGEHAFGAEHCTYEGMIVQYADDITWAIENLNDANNVALLNNNLPSTGLYYDLSLEIDEKCNQSNNIISRALMHNDSGGLYGFFISDLISNTKRTFESLKQKDGAHERQALREGSSESFISLSEDGELILETMIAFLKKRVFSEPRVKNRKEMLSSIVNSSLDLLYSSEDTIKEYIEDYSKQEAWTKERLDEAKKNISDEVHRVQLSVDIFSSMSDQEIYDFVGMHSL